MHTSQGRACTAPLPSREAPCAEYTCSRKRASGSTWWSSSANMCYGWAGGRASVPPGMDSCVVSIRRRCWLVGACRVVQLSCYELHEGKHHGCSRSTAWRRHLQLAEQLECCCGCAWRRAARGVPPTTVEPTRGRSSTVLGLGRAHLIRLPALGAQDRMAAPVVAVVTMCLNNTYRR